MQLVTVPDTDFLEDLDVRQKQALVGAQLGRIRATTKAEAGRLTSTFLDYYLAAITYALHRYPRDAPSARVATPSSLLRNAREARCSTENILRSVDTDISHSRCKFIPY